MTDIEKYGSIAIKEHLASCTVIIYSKASEHGSGVAVRHRNQEYILTAAHVLNGESDNEKIRIVERANVPLKDVQKDELADSVWGVSQGPLTVSAPTPINIIQRIVSKDDEDIAALKIRDADKYLPNTIFHNLSAQGETQISVGTGVIIFGYPGELGQQFDQRLTRQGCVVLFPYIDLIEIKEIADNNQLLNPEVHFITDSTTYHQGLGVNPKGMSGCGVWSLPKFKDGQLWDLGKKQLLGIQTSHYPQRKLLVIVRIERLLDLLSNGESRLYR